MDSVGTSLMVALAASLTASVSGLIAVRPRSTTARMESAESEDLPTATQAVPEPADMAPAKELRVIEREEVINLSPPSGQETATILSASAAPAPAERPAKIIAVKGIERKEWPIEGGRLIIGRSQEAECFIPSLTVSRKHAIVERRGSQIILTDCGSRNGTYVRGVRIDQPVALRNHDTIEMGEISLEVVIG
jgi:hypothetical protein